MTSGILCPFAATCLGSFWRFKHWDTIYFYEQEDFFFPNKRIFFYLSNRITHVFTICWENSHRKKKHDPSDCSYLRIHATAPLHFIQYDQRKLHLSVLIRSYYIQKCSTARETIFPPKIFPKTTKHVHSQTKLVDWSACLRTVASLLKIGSESCWVV